MAILSTQFRLISIALTICFMSSACTHIPDRPSTSTAHSPSSFTALIVTDAETSADWYRSVFDLDMKRKTETERFKQFMLAGPDMLLELIEFNPRAPIAPNRALGIFKHGIVVDQFDARIAKLHEANVELSGNGRVIYDEEIGLHSIVILDPDGNRLQLFGTSEMDAPSP